MNGEGRSGPRAANVEALLEEAPWLRRLARGLLGDEAAAEDLSQDVLAAALRERVELSGFRLRAWLRTVARRIAGRSRSREQLRRTVEERAARSEVERDASERLDVHRRLAAAIERLPPTYRTALVLRYFEELEPRAIAERLGIPAPTVRKRLSRGLALLRAELDRDYGGRKSWALALGACLAERETATAGPTGGIGTAGTTVLAMSIVKLALLAIAPAGILGLWWWRVPGSTDVVLPVSPVARAEEIAAPASTQGSRSEGAGESARRAVDLPTEVAVEEAPAAAPRLRIVDSAGEPIAGSRAASIDARGFVRAIDLDEAASAELPEGSLGFRFAASAPGYGPALSEPWSNGEIEVALAPLRVIRGMVLEDGGAPSRPIEMSCWFPDPPWPLGTSARLIQTALADLNILGKAPRVRTEDDGAFQLEVPPYASSASLRLPPSHAVIAVDRVPVPSEEDGERSRAKVSLDGGDLLVETVLLPTISGRLLWSDGGEPAANQGIEYWFTDGAGRNGTVTGLYTDVDGAFRIGISRDRETQLLHPHLPDSTAKTFHVSASGKGFRDVYLAVDLDAIELPHDLGVIEIERAPVLDLRIADGSGTPVEGALAWTQEGSGRTDRDGLARIEFEVGTELRVLAPGYSLASLMLEAKPAGPVELTLEPGLALEVHARGPDGAAFDAGVRLKVSWDRTPFEGARPGEGPRPWGIHYAYERMQGCPSAFGAVGGGNYLDPAMPGYHYTVLPPNRQIVIPGLQMGAELRLGLVGCFEPPLVERIVRLQDTPGIQRVDLGGLRSGNARLLVTVQGAPLAEGSVLVQPTGGGNGTSFPIRDGQAEIGPMLAGTFDVDVRRQGHPPHRVEACELVPGGPPLWIELEP